MKRSIESLAACVLCALLGPSGASATGQGADWEFATGADYTSGSYGNTVDTEILYVPFTVRMRGEHLKLELTVPYMRLDGPGDVVGPRRGPVVVDPQDPTVTSSSGLGDVVAGVGYVLPRLGDGGPLLELKARTRIPTADDGLGTDEPDYSAHVEALQPLGTRLTLIAGIGYQWLGDPDDLELEDGLIGTLGLNLKASTATDLGVLLDHRRRSFADLDDQRNVVPYVSWRATSGLGLMLYGVFGATESSPDYGGGLQVSFVP